MKSPKEMQIIQIDITNACPFTCSNCTRMCGHHEKTFMMDFETFQRAVDSLEGYEGCVSMMGGEPTLHPEFEKFALYLKSKYPHLYEENQETDLLHPVDDYLKTVQDIQLKYTVKRKTKSNKMDVVPAPCLYSMMGSSYFKHFELIQDVFKRQVLNDHQHEMFHQPSLISRKDLGIEDEAWIPLRDACWVQNTWSASITPKGAFFCEVAGALDMLFHGEGGWPIEKEWWKREPKDFADQLHWCEICGFACETFTRNANESIDDVSDILYEKLKTVNSPKVKANKVNIIKVTDGVIAEESKASEFTYSQRDLETGSPYIKYFSDKVNRECSLLHPSVLTKVLHIFRDTPQAAIEKSFAEGKCQETVVIFETEKLKEQWGSARGSGEEEKWFSLESMSYGKILNHIFKLCQKDSYFIFLSAALQITDHFIDKFKDSTPNPGTLIYSQWKNGEKKPTDWVTGDVGFVGIMHQNASSFRRIGFDRRSKVNSFQEFANLWTENKNIPMDENLFVYSAKDVVEAGERCAIFGAGGRASDIYSLIQQKNATCLAVVDSNPEKHGTVMEELTIGAPDSLLALKDQIDRVLIGSPIYYEEMTDKLLEFGFDQERISKI